MKTLLATALAVLCALPVSADSIDKLNAHIDQTNFIVNGGCSGTLIDLSARLILTNYHCIDKAVRTETRQVVGKDGMVSDVRFERLEPVNVGQKVYKDFRVVASGMWSSKIIAKDKSTDLALLQIIAETIPMRQSAVLSASEPRRGDDIFIVGNPLGMDASVGRGIVSSTNRFVAVAGVEKAYYQVDAGITGGNSGGALYNDALEFIGVPAAAAQGTVIGLAIPLPTIKAFLTEACYASIFDAEAEDYDACMEPDED